MAVTGSARPLLFVLPTGNEGSSSSGVNHGIIAQLKVTEQFELTGPLTTDDTIDGIDVANHNHEAAAGEGVKLDHDDCFSDFGTDNHTEYSLADGTRAFSGEVVGVTPTADASLATKGYVDSVAEGLKVIAPCLVRAQGNLNLSAIGTTIDGVTMSTDDRFLADQQSTGAQDGVYLYKGAATPAVRTDDVPTGYEAAGMFVWIMEGDTDADVGYVCTNDKPNDVVGTDALTMVVFSRAADYTAGDGIDITTNTVSVDLGTDPGLEFVSNALEAKVDAASALEKTSSGIAINLEASNPSFQFAANELGLKIDASGGLQKGSSGTGVKIDDTPDTLDVDSDGLKVVGLPSLFKINGTAVGSDVTGPNLDTLTDGSSGVTIHTHDLTAHAIGSASHTASTIALLNSKISDLIATYGAVRDIGVGTAAQRPSAGTAGRFWWSNDTDALSYDNGATWDEIVAVAAAHDFEGSSHTACTLAEFNAANTISDADLDDSGDPRDPNAHDFEGSAHTACTLAEFNAANTISDADLIDTNDGRLSDDRSPLAHDFEGLAHTACTLAEFNAANTISDYDLAGLAGDNTWGGDNDFGEVTIDTLLMDGAVIGPQVAATIGTGGITPGDALKFDGSGQIVRRAANSDSFIGFCSVGGSASATGFYVPFGIAEVTWEVALDPSAYGEACFLSQTGSSEFLCSTAVPTAAGKIWEFFAWGTGVTAKVYFSPQKQREIEA